MTYRQPGRAGLSGIIRDQDGAFIPDDEGNTDWQAYQAWLAAGNSPTPAPAAAVAVPTVTGRQIKDQVTAGGFSAGVVSFLAKVGQSGGPKPDDYLYWLGIALDTPVPTTTPKVGRILIGGGVVNTDGSSAVPSFMAAAALLPA